MPQLRACGPSCGVRPVSIRSSLTRAARLNALRSWESSCSGERLSPNPPRRQKRKRHGGNVALSGREPAWWLRGGNATLRGAELLSWKLWTPGWGAEFRDRSFLYVIIWRVLWYRAEQQKRPGRSERSHWRSHGEVDSDRGRSGRVRLLPHSGGDHAIVAARPQAPTIRTDLAAIFVSVEPSRST